MLMAEQPTDKQVWSALLAGGEWLADDAIAKWRGGVYGGDGDYERTRVAVEHWQAVKKRMRELVEDMKKRLEEGND